LRDCQEDAKRMEHRKNNKTTFTCYYLQHGSRYINKRLYPEATKHQTFKIKLIGH